MPNKIGLPDVFQLYQKFYYKDRSCNAWWNGLRTGGVWHVRFHADFTPSNEWMAESDDELFHKFLVETDKWKNNVQKYWDSILVNTKVD